VGVWAGGGGVGSRTCEGSEPLYEYLAKYGLELDPQVCIHKCDASGLEGFINTAH
jgi:hypothetical protein